MRQASGSGRKAQQPRLGCPSPFPFPRTVKGRPAFGVGWLGHASLIKKLLPLPLPMSRPPPMPPPLTGGAGGLQGGAPLDEQLGKLHVALGGERKGFLVHNT
jgi:hypothetical protein